MDIGDKIEIFASKNESETTNAADYMKECNIECLVEQNEPGTWLLYVDKADEKKARELLTEFFPGKPEKKEKKVAKEWEDEVEVPSGDSGLSILGVSLLCATVIVIILSFIMHWGQGKIINIILVSLTLLVNGYNGIFKRKSLGTALFIVSLIGLFFIVVAPAPKASTSGDPQTVAMTYMNAGDYPAALQKFEEALTVAREEKNVQSEAFILSYMANIYKERNLIDRSLEYYQKALDLFMDSGLPDMQKIIQPEIDKIKAEYGK